MPAYALEIIVVALGLLMLIVEAFVPLKDKASLAQLGALGLAAVFLLLFAVDPAVSTDGPFWQFYTSDKLAMFYKGIALVTTILVLLMAVDFRSVLQKYTAPQGSQSQAGLGEFVTLPVFACAGLMWMASANNLVSIFVSLEAVTMTFYVLVAFMRRNIGSLEAGVKYLILGALSTGFLVYGFTWLFGITGATNLADISAALSGGEVNTSAALFAFALIVVALGFKVGAVPFQIWIPDVYQGAPTPITAFLSVGSKAAGFLVFFRLAEPFLISDLLSPKVIFILTIVAAATLIYGNLAALPQSNFKRLMAYSSISHAGFILMGLAAVRKLEDYELGNALNPINAISFYLAAYLLMTLLAFLVLTLVRAQLHGEQLETFNGLGKRSPFLAFALLIAMVSLAGVPLTAGFNGKFAVFLVAIQQELYWLVAIGVLGAAAGFYYYLKVVRSMYFQPFSASPSAGGSAAATAAPLIISTPTRVAIALLIAAILFFGVYPAPIFNLLN